MEGYYGYGDWRYTNGSIRPTNLTSLAMTGVTPQQIATSLNLQQSYAEQECYKRLEEMMSEDEKRKVSLINTASGRAALRGKVNKFGTLDARPNEKKVLICHEWRRPGRKYY